MMKHLGLQNPWSAIILPQAQLFNLSQITFRRLLSSQRRVFTNSKHQLRVSNHPGKNKLLARIFIGLEFFSESMLEMGKLSRQKLIGIGNVTSTRFFVPERMKVFKNWTIRWITYMGRRRDRWLKRWIKATSIFDHRKRESSHLVWIFRSERGNV